MAQQVEATLGYNLEMARRRLRWTLADLENETGIPSSTLSNYENDKTEPPLHRLQLIARALGTTPNDLLAFDRPTLE